MNSGGLRVARGGSGLKPCMIQWLPVDPSFQRQSLGVGFRAHLPHDNWGCRHKVLWLLVCQFIPWSGSNCFRPHLATCLSQEDACQLCLGNLLRFQIECSLHDSDFSATRSYRELVGVWLLASLSEGVPRDTYDVLKFVWLL